MPKYLISHPDPKFTADLVGLRFQDGTATVDTDKEGGLAAYSYCQRAGYTINPAEPEPTDARTDRARKTTRSGHAANDEQGEQS